MIAESSPRSPAFLGLFPRFASGITVGVGALVLLGWALDIAFLRSVLPQLVAMNPATALCFILAGLSLWLLRAPGHPERDGVLSRRLGRLCALTVALIALLRLADILLGLNLNPDQILFREKLTLVHTRWPSRMAPNTAASFLFVALALLLLDAETRRGRRPAQYLTLAAVCIALLALVGYAYGVESLYGMASYIPMALNTALAFLILSLGVLAARPDRGLMALLTSPGVGGSLARRMLPAAFAVPLLLGWVRWIAQESFQLYDTRFGVALYAASMIVVFALLVWQSSVSLDRADRERCRTEAALAASEARFRSLLEAAPAAIVGVDLEGCIRVVNQQAEKIFVYDREEMLGQPVEILVPERYRPEHPGHRAAYVVDPQPRFMGPGRELWARRKDGSEFSVEIGLSPVKTESGFLVMSLIQDITKRKQAEAALEEFHRFFNLSLDLLCVAGFDGYFKRLNPSWEKTLGYPIEELLARPYVDFIHPDDRQATLAEADKLTQGVSVLTFENRYRAKDGSYRWLLWKSTPLPEQGLIYAAARDITERKQAEDARARLAAIIESSDDAILSKDLEGKILTWNTGAERIYGYSATEVIGHSISLLVPPGRGDEMPQLLARIRRGEPLSHCETERVCKDGRRVQISLTVSPVRDPEGRIVGASSIARDITERKQAEAALVELNRELEAFTYSVSHDLRAPLRHIDGFARILLEEHCDRLDPSGQHYLARVRQAAQNMGRLLDDLLNFSRIGRRPLNRQIAGLNSLVREALDDLKPEVEGRSIDWRIASLPFVDCDPALMKQVFLNLLSNALKFTRPRERAVIEVGQKEQDGQPVVFVRDNGVGFSMKYADKLFGVFQRLHRPEDFEGTGVGLATVQRILQKHGGRVWAEAELDKGATFYFSLGPSAGRESETPSAAIMGGEA